MNPLPAPGLFKGREEGKSAPPALKGRARKTSPKEKMGKGCSVLQDGPGPGTTGRAGKESHGSYAMLELWASFAQAVKICPNDAHSGAQRWHSGDVKVASSLRLKGLEPEPRGG